MPGLLDASQTQLTVASRANASRQESLDLREQVLDRRERELAAREKSLADRYSPINVERQIYGNESAWPR
jgi:hypothetical protein